jgi:Na+/H+ antiporter NhaD/arsenite permease-like protein
MALVLIAIMLVGLVLIATESLNHINKAAVAMFAGVSCWLVFIAYGADIVRAEHATDFERFISEQSFSSVNVKDFVASHIFFKYIVQCASIVLFLLATTSIVEVLNNNGCFDFLHEWLRTRRPRKLLWMLAFFTFVISANLDNLVTVVLMLSIIHPLLQTDKQRRIYGTVVILAANCGGAITVIGDLTSLKLWNDGLVTPSLYFMKLVIPVCASLVVMLMLLGRNLPARIELSLSHLPYRGDDTLLSRPQRLLMLFVGMGGLWFIPSFHRITHLPPFLGAFCVLALLWMVNELCNRQLLGSDKMVLRRLPMALQYANLQNILYFVGLTLMFGAVSEAGVFHYLFSWLNNISFFAPCVALVTSILSAIFGNVPVLLGSVEVMNQMDLPHQVSMTDGALWPALSFASSIGGSMLLTGSIAGVLLMRMEGMSFRWYLRHITPKVIAGFLVGYAIVLVMTLCNVF